MAEMLLVEGFFLGICPRFSGMSDKRLDWGIFPGNLSGISSATVLKKLRYKMPYRVLQFPFGGAED